MKTLPHYSSKNLVVMLGVAAVSTLGVSIKASATTVAAPSIIYDTQVQHIGWQHDPNNSSTWFKNGQEAGTNGRSLRMESIKIALQLPKGMTGGVEYDAHVQGIGWQKASNPNVPVNPTMTIRPESEWFTNGQTAGTVGRAKRMEAFTVKLTGEIAKHYNVVYDSHVQNIGWQYENKGLYWQAPNFETPAPISDWFKNGQEVGTDNHALRMEALEIQLAKKPTTTANKTITVNKSDLGATLSSTAGYTQIYKNVPTPTTVTTTDVWGDKTVTTCVFKLWHKTAATETIKNVTVNKDESGKILSSTSGYTKVSSSTATSTSTAANGDKTITNTTTVIWHKTGTTVKNVTIDKDTNGNVLTGKWQYIDIAKGYVIFSSLPSFKAADGSTQRNFCKEVSSSTATTTSTTANGDQVVTNTTTTIWKVLPAGTPGSQLSADGDQVATNFTSNLSSPSVVAALKQLLAKTPAYQPCNATNYAAYKAMERWMLGNYASNLTPTDAQIDIWNAYTSAYAAGTVTDEQLADANFAEAQYLPTSELYFASYFDGSIEDPAANDVAFEDTEPTATPAKLWTPIQAAEADILMGYTPSTYLLQLINAEIANGIDSIK